MRSSGADRVDRVAGVIERVAVGVGGAVADLPEALAGWLDGWSERVGAVVGWPPRAVAGLLDVAGAVLVGSAGIVGGVPAGLVRAVTGVVLWDRALVGRGAVGVASSIGGAGVLLVGTSVAALQRVVGAEAPARRLSDDERTMLRAVFGDSVALGSVRLVQGRSGAFGANDRPFTLGNAIYLKDLDLTDRLDVLVHEVVHVWQHQHEGPRYATDALGAQVRYGWRGRGAYDWRAELGRGRASWAAFNKEAQGSCIQEIWRSGGGAELGYDELAAGAVAELRGRRAWRWSARPSSGA